MNARTEVDYRAATGMVDSTGPEQRPAPVSALPKPAGPHDDQAVVSTARSAAGALPPVGSAERVGERASPDPLRATDRYRLVAPIGLQP